MGFFDKVMDKIGMRDEDNSGEEGYVELDTEVESTKSKIIVRPFVLHDFDNIKDILDSIRTGNTIALVNMKPLKEKDLIELKRAINKLKKTTDAMEGEIAGFGEDYIVVTPSFATIYRSKGESPKGGAMPKKPQHYDSDEDQPSRGPEITKY
ncbi:MAG: cell division protein SepF [Candidatus Woesearchaeota archaeon]